MPDVRHVTHASRVAVLNQSVVLDASSVYPGTRPRARVPGTRQVSDGRDGTDTASGSRMGSAGWCALGRAGIRLFSVSMRP